MGSPCSPCRGASRSARCARITIWPARLEPRYAIRCADRPRGFEFETLLLIQKRTGWDSNPRGREPTRFPIVRLKPLGHPSSYARDESTRPCASRWIRPFVGSVEPEWDSSLRANHHLARSTRPTLCDLLCRSPAWVRIRNLSDLLQAEGVGFEPTRTFRSNALAGRRLKPLGHPSKAGTVRFGRSLSDELPR